MTQEDWYILFDKLESKLSETNRQLKRIADALDYFAGQQEDGKLK